ncbi:uncharacterized protein LOC128952225 [Oppia nitens]|uniref:uncharacterized protein LOC128952225 n=1 Tax=Oppia nitens TaxID=1686743 RepID=UPI0023DAD34A|nr:uncharacterized protein LOC128952225 [Oppia nitens]
MLTLRTGPRLMADRSHFEKSMVEMPGEGKTFTTKEEGTKVWHNKTRRKYYETVPPAEPNPRDHHHRSRTDLKAIDYRSDRSDTSHHHNNHRRRPQQQQIRAVTDDQKIVTAEELDDIFLEDPKGYYELQNSESYSYIPTVRDVGIQCNRKKTDKHLVKGTSSESTDSYVRVIKSSDDGMVTAYSDVPQLKTVGSPSKRPPVLKHKVLPQSEAIYSKVDKSKKKVNKNDELNGYPEYEDYKDYPQIIYKSPINERQPSRLSNYSKYSGISEYSTPPTNRILKNKTKGIGFTLRSGIDEKEIKLPNMSPKLRSRSLSRFQEPTTHRRWDDDDDSPVRHNVSGHKKEVKQEVLEETISISNASSDDLQPYDYKGEFEQYLSPKPQFIELDHKRKEISYVNDLPSAADHSSRPRIKNGTESPSISSRVIPLDYRRGINAVTYGTDNESSYSTLSRHDMRKKDKLADFTPPPRQAYTLDRRVLKERQKQLESSAAVPLSPPTETKPKDRARLHRSTTNLSDYSRDNNNNLRGGLANAYRNRQTQPEKRTSSLNRMSAIREDHIHSPSQSTPVRYLSHNQLNSAGNSANSSSDSDTINRHRQQRQQQQFVHDREPIVMYIPAVSHHNKRATDESDRLSSILRPSSRAGSTASSTAARKPTAKRPIKGSAASDIGPTKPRDYPMKYSNYNKNNQKHMNDEELDEIVELKDTKSFGKLKNGKSILSRRHSIPKDTKFPWLSKLKSKVKFRDP